MTQNNALRSPIVSVLGHVDHGKSSLLDTIRGSNICGTEAGAITQAIGASMVSLDAAKKICGPLLDQLQLKFSIPGLLFIDTPGHAAFSSLRKRGGALADIAIVVVDINDGFMPQTEEAIQILRQAKTPFVIAANKIDLIAGYRKKADRFLVDLPQQSTQFQELIDTKVYQLVGSLHEKFGLESERFDRVDYTKQVAIIPCSAKQHVGLAELLMVLMGLAQKYLETSLKLEIKGPARGTILEVKEEQGLGTTLDVIIYDGTLSVNDTIVLGGPDGPIVTKVRALLLPAPLAEMRDKKTKYTQVKSVQAATGVKVSAPDIKDVWAGTPLLACEPAEAEQYKEDMGREIEGIVFDTDKDGIIIKADTLGSLEAMLVLFRQKQFKIRKAGVGPISKKDISEAEANADKDPFTAVIIGFNIPPMPSTDKVHIITGDIIYTLLDRYDEFLINTKEQEKAKVIDTLVRPCKVEVLQNCLFRQRNPCIVGVEVVAGMLKSGMPIMKNGQTLGVVKSIQQEGSSVNNAEKGEQVAISIPDAVGGRDILEGDFLFSAVPEEDFRELRKLAKFLDAKEKDVLREIAEIHRQKNVVWGV